MISLFYDGLAVHKTKEATAYIDNILKWKRILNVGYQSEDNPIEIFFSFVKRKYRAKFLKRSSELYVSGEDSLDISMLVEESFEESK